MEALESQEVFDLAVKGNVLIRGWGATLLLRSVPHIPCVRVCAPLGVRVNAVNPGVTVTNLHRSGGMNETQYGAFLERSKETHPLGRPGQPDEVAALILFLASEQAGWMTGETIPIDGGRHLTCLR